MRKIIVLSAVAVCAAAYAGAQTPDAEQNLDSVEVRGSRHVADLRQVPYTVSVVGREKLDEGYRPSILPTLTEQIPSMFSTSRGMLGFGVSGGAAGAISMRGLGGGMGQLLVLIDGHPQYQGIYGHPIADSYLSQMAERVEVVRGPASTLYGSSAMGGVVNIVTRAMPEHGVSTDLNAGAGSYGTVQTAAQTRMCFGRFSGSAAGHYQRSDNHRPHMGFEQYGGSLRAGYDISEHWGAALDADITHFNASNPGTVQSPLLDARQWITRGAFSLSLDNDYGWTKGSLSIFDNFGRHKINDGEAVGAPKNARYFRSKDALAGASWHQSARLFRGNLTTIGADYSHIYGRAYYTSIATGKTIATPAKQSGHSHRNEIAGYADFRQTLASWITLDAGLRLSHHSISGTEWVPQGSVTLRPMSTGELKLSVAKGFRNPTMRELYLYPPSNTDLSPERLMNYEASWRHTLAGGKLRYGVNIFYLKGDNVIQTVVRDGRPHNENSGKIENSGAEVEAAWKVTPALTLTTNHSVLHMVSHVQGAPEYKGYLGADWRWHRLTLGCGIMQVAGLYTLTGAKEKTENFTLLNATAKYNIYKGVDIWARGENLLAQKYETYYGFPMPRATVMAGVNVSF